MGRLDQLQAAAVDLALVSDDYRKLLDSIVAGTWNRGEAVPLTAREHIRWKMGELEQQRRDERHQR